MIGAVVRAVFGAFAGQLINSEIQGNAAVAEPQAYALVGMAGTLASVYSVPLTSVLLLYELTKDYRILLPLMNAARSDSEVIITIKTIDIKNAIGYLRRYLRVEEEKKEVVAKPVREPGKTTEAASVKPPKAEECDEGEDEDGDLKGVL
ncbi:hypothetical protein POM88_045005 [Heracleum sosnowskyi]|uniref:Uncharacterized protein n=1 Tax=Heracleum sosnowskyi TaxID=360622 RepID=A0AAD8H550_9APIA|nr:hypothetical protein POM88_045005 [Heracleum sosnowskyi]